MPAFDDAPRLSDEECAALFHRLFPQGLSGGDIFAALAPEGWEKSPLLAAFHPSPEQVWEESVAMHENLENLLRARKPGSERKPAPTLDEIKAEWSAAPVEPEREMTDLLGKCLWKIFSDNHSVIADDGREVDIGSFRGAGGFLADFAGGGRCYMDFYMGTIWIEGRCDLTPVFEFLFRRLREHGLDWIYSFPALHVVRFDKPEAEPAIGDYDPSQAVGAEVERKEEDAEFAKLQDELRALDEEARAAARQHPPPETGLAYRNVFGRFPEGWPP